MRRRFLRVFVAIGFAAFASGARPQARIELSAGVHRIEAEVATDEPSRARGLMYRRELPERRGMLFVFPNLARHCMWMKNTHVPLSVAYLDGAGRIVNIEDMIPETEDAHCAAKPVRHALEMGRGWFTRRGIGPGARISGLDQVPEAR